MGRPRRASRSAVGGSGQKRRRWLRPAEAGATDGAAEPPTASRSAVGDVRVGLRHGWVVMISLDLFFLFLGTCICISASSKIYASHRPSKIHTDFQSRVGGQLNHYFERNDTREISPGGVGGQSNNYPELDGTSVLEREQKQNVSEMQAETLYLREIKSNPKSPGPLCKYATFLLRDKRQDAAARCFEDALQLSPRHVPSLCNFGVLLYRMGSKRAEHLLRSALDFGGPAALISNSVAVIYSRLLCRLLRISYLTCSTF